MFQDSGMYSDFNWQALLNQAIAVGERAAMGFANPGSSYVPNQYPYAPYNGYYTGAPFVTGNPYAAGPAPVVFTVPPSQAGPGGGFVSPGIFDTYNNSGLFSGTSGASVLIVAGLLLAAFLIAKA